MNRAGTTDAPDLVRAYLNEIGTVPLLTAQGEVDLAKRIEAGLYAAQLLRHDRSGEPSGAERRELEIIAREGVRAKDQMIRANLRLVVAAARKRPYRGLAFLDLVQEGNLGLIRAVEKFDYAKGYKFSTYAMWWIRQAMQRGEARNAHIIRLPDHVLEQLTMLERAERGLATRLCRDPSVAELAEAAGLTVARVAELRRVPRAAVSLDSPIGEDGEATLADHLEHIRAGHDDDVEQRDRAARLRRMLADLSPLERSVLTLRYGLDDGRNRTLRETAADVGLDQGGVRRLERQALKRLRGPLPSAA